MKLFKVIFLIACFISSTLKIYAQDKLQEPGIDNQLQQCLDSSKNSTTAGMIDCTIRARDAWDNELNRYYKLLMQILSDDEKAKLKQHKRTG